MTGLRRDDSAKESPNRASIQEVLQVVLSYGECRSPSEASILSLCSGTGSSTSSAKCQDLLSSSAFVRYWAVQSVEFQEALI